MIFIILNATSFLLIALIFGGILLFDRRRSLIEINNLKLIILSAMLIAIAVVLNITFSRFLGSILSAKLFQIRVGEFALLLIGICCGGILGALSGVASDFIGVLIDSHGTPVLFFTLTSVVWCIAPLYLIRFFNSIYQSKYSIYFYLILSSTLVFAVISFSNPLILMLMYDSGNKVKALYLTRIIVFPISVTLNTILILTSYKTLNKILDINEKLGINKIKYLNNDKIIMN